MLTKGSCCTERNITVERCNAYALMATYLARFVWQPTKRVCQLARQTNSAKCLAKQDVPPNGSPYRPCQMGRHTNLAKWVVMQTARYFAVR
ncbi:hypothetical protein Y032_0157g3214 [Ancylostoma ceylanicum]|uniref:Uncharacterized protein n=1 Tax=Ancylostoma ceylanicum TaxID=53326 RepID=A0A016SYY8_9BILA|nr:hypothetical protein Y032_0157g3214 [Ancylostoma ceylanicum]